MRMHLFSRGGDVTDTQNTKGDRDPRTTTHEAHRHPDATTDTLDARDPPAHTNKHNTKYHANDTVQRPRARRVTRSREGRA